MAESTLTVNRWTPTRKAAITLELLRGADVVELARIHGLRQAQLLVWRDRFVAGGQAALKTRRGRGEQDHLVRELERKVGQLTLENEQPVFLWRQILKNLKIYFFSTKK